MRAAGGNVDTREVSQGSVIDRLDFGTAEFEVVQRTQLPRAESREDVGQSVVQPEGMDLLMPWAVINKLEP